MGWIQPIIRRLDYLRGRYQAFVVETDEDRAGCMEVLSEVRQQELNRVSGQSVLESSAFVDSEVEDQLFGCRDKQTGEIVGCIRATCAEQLIGIDASRSEYSLDSFPPDVLKQTYVLTRLAFLKPYRKTAATLVLFQTMYRFGLSNGYLLTLLSCEPGLYPGYLRLGCRPLGPVHPGSSGGFRIPMVYVNHDREHLEQVHSPIARTLSKSDEEMPAEGVRWYRQFVAERGPIDVGVAFYSNDEADAVHAPLTRGLSSAGRAELLRNAVKLDCRPGDVIIADGDGGRAMGFVESGIVQVAGKDRVLAMLGEGELFGEMAVALDTRRTARVVAASDDTRVLMLSQSCLERLEAPADQAQVWRNLARVMAERVRRSNR